MNSMHRTRVLGLAAAVGLTGLLVLLATAPATVDRDHLAGRAEAPLRQGPVATPAENSVPPTRTAVDPGAPAPLYVAYDVSATLTTEVQTGDGQPSTSQLDLRGLLHVGVRQRDDEGVEVDLTVSELDMRTQHEAMPAGADPVAALVAKRLAATTPARLSFDGSVAIAVDPDPGVEMLQLLVTLLPLAGDGVADRSWTCAGRDWLGAFEVAFRRQLQADGCVVVHKRHLGYAPGGTAGEVREYGADGEGELDAGDGWLRAGHGREQMTVALADASTTLRRVFVGDLRRTDAARAQPRPARSIGELLTAMADLVREGKAKSRQLDALLEELATVLGGDAAAFAAVVADLESNELDVDVAHAAILAIGRSHAPGASAFLVEHLSSSTARSAQRLAAAEAIHGLGTDDCTRSACAAAFACPDASRAAMLRALLGLVSPTDAAATADTLLGGESDAIAAGAHAAWIDALARLDDPRAHAAVDARLGHDDPDVRIAAARALAHRRDAEATLRLYECLDAENVSTVRAATLRALAAAAEDAQMDLVGAALRAETDTETRIGAIEELAASRPLRPRAVALLRDLATHDAESAVRETARLALGGRQRQ